MSACPSRLGQKGVTIRIKESGTGIGVKRNTVVEMLSVK